LHSVQSQISSAETVAKNRLFVYFVIAAISTDCIPSLADDLTETAANALSSAESQPIRFLFAADSLVAECQLCSVHVCLQTKLSKKVE